MYFVGVEDVDVWCCFCFYVGCVGGWFVLWYEVIGMVGWVVFVCLLIDYW